MDGPGVRVLTTPTSAPHRPLFSAIIPTYNRAGTVTRAIDSALEQSCTDFEILVIDDGSTDNTPAVLEQYGNRIRYFRKANGGCGAARNYGIERSRGAYLAFLDSDDWWYPNKLERVVDAIRRAPNVGLFHSRAHIVHASGKRLRTFRSKQTRDGHGYRQLLRANFVCMSTPVVRRDCFEDVGMFDVNLGGLEDWDMWIRIARRFSLHLIPECLVAYQYHSPDSMMVNSVGNVGAIESVHARALRAGPNLGEREVRRAQAELAYAQGLTLVSYGDEGTAQRYFRQSLLLHIWSWKPRLYLALIKHPWLRSKLPRFVARRLQFPDVVAGLSAPPS